MTRYVFDALFRYAFLPSVLIAAAVAFVRNVRALFRESRDAATALAVGERAGCDTR